MKQDRIEAMVAGLVQGEALPLARFISWAEDRDPRISEILRRTYPRTGNAYRLGITGPPGAGKSTLIARYAVALRRRGERVAVVAVDPTSPFTGGALLGDRYRMTELSEDPGIFMRSMASRGSLGGLAAATEEAADLLDAAGFGWILVETVGVGQVEMDIARATDTVLVVLVPESGDGIQAMKAGLMEIGDLFVVNKADRDGAGRLGNALEGMLDLRAGQARRPEVMKMVATTGEGLEELMAAIDRHRREIEDDGSLTEHRRRVLRERLLGETRQAVSSRIAVERASELERVLDRVARREMTPHDAALEVVERLFTGSPAAGPKES